MRRSVLLRLGNDRGMVLIMALVMMGLLGALAGAYVMLVRSDVVLSGGASRAREGFYAAEAGLNVGMAEFANIFRNFSSPSEADLEERTITVGDRVVHYDLDEVSGYAPCTELQPDCFTTIPAGEKFAGLNTIPYRYRARSIAENSEGDNEAELGAEFDVHNIPIFQFLAFSVPDLYVMPAENATFTGRIHTNGDLYLNINSGATLTVQDNPPAMDFVQVSSADHVYRGGRKSYTGQVCTGTVVVDALLDTVAPSGNLDPRTLACVGDGSSPVSAATIAAYAGSISDGVDTIQVPEMDMLQRGGDGVFWENADLRIVLRLDLPRAAINFGAANGTRIVGRLFSHLPLERDRARHCFPSKCKMRRGRGGIPQKPMRSGSLCANDAARFFTPIAHNNPPTPPANNTTYSNTRTNYTPTFPDPSGNANDNNAMVYRRVGEDTNGDGVVNNGDRNDDICPIANAAGDAQPAWRPSYCNGAQRITNPAVVTTYGAWPQAALGAQNTPSISSWYNDFDYRRGGFYNNREGRWLYMLNVNIRVLIDWNEANGDSLFTRTDDSDGGIVIFLSVQGSESNNAQNGYGVRIFDSADLNTTGGTFVWTAPSDPTGLTVASDQAIYIQGNYNSVQQYPAAVIGDAINVLSQGWEVATGAAADPIANDRKSAADLSSDRRDVPAQDSYWRRNNLNNGAPIYTSLVLPWGAAVSRERIT